MAHSFDNVSTERSVGVEQRRRRHQSAVDNQLRRTKWGTPLEVGATNLNAFAAYQSNLVKCESKGSKYSFCQNSLLLCRRENHSHLVKVHGSAENDTIYKGMSLSDDRLFTCCELTVVCVTWPNLTWHYGDVVDEVMEDNCTMRPCATDFSIAAIMSRHGRAPRTRCRERDPPDSISPLGKNQNIHTWNSIFQIWFE